MKYEVGDTISIDTGNGKAEGVIISVDGNDFICHLTNAKLRVHADKVFQTNRQWLESLSDEEFVRNTNDKCFTCQYFKTEDYWKCINAFGECEGQDCTGRRLQWLQAEHKENK